MKPEGMSVPMHPARNFNTRRRPRAHWAAEQPVVSIPSVGRQCGSSQLARCAAKTAVGRGTLRMSSTWMGVRIAHDVGRAGVADPGW